MSRTDKDRPWWVINHQDANDIDHDHRNGECIEKTLELAKFYNGARSYRQHKHCKKSFWVDVTCVRKKVDGKKQIVYSHELKSRWDNYRPKTRGQLPCWSRVCDNHTHGEYDWEGRAYCTDKVNTQCLGHELRVYDRSIPCDCDTWPDRPTCDPRARDTRGGYRHYTWGGVPTWFVRDVYHRPERRRATQRLNNMAREYNEHGDIDDDDYFNRPARSSARWLWW